MTDAQLLLAISDIMDKKIKPLEDSVQELKDSVKRLELMNENEIIPRLQNLEECYVSTYKRYANGVEQIDTIQLDVDMMKKVIAEHSEKLQKIS